MNTFGIIRRWKSIFADRIRYSASMQRILGSSRLVLASIFKRGYDRLSARARAHRVLLPVSTPQSSSKRLKKLIASAGCLGDGSENPWKNPRSGWDRYRANTRDGLPMLSHGLVIKPKVSDDEKGILVVWVEYNLAALLRAESLAEILRDYQIIFSTSWSPPDIALIAALAGEPDAEIWVIPSNAADRGWLADLPSPVSVLPFFASHWISADDYKDVLGLDDEYDFCAVANWAPFKRHWTLFRALRKMPDDIRIALIGQPEGNHTVDTARQMAGDFGVRQEITWFNRLEPGEVRRIQASSRCGLMLSLREGSCLAVVESLLADKPVGMFENAHVGSLEFINRQTGKRLREDSLADDLIALLDQQKRNQFAPRAWALDHAEAHLSSQRLNEILEKNAEVGGKPWTRPLIPFCLRKAKPEFIDRDQQPLEESWKKDFESRYAVSLL